MPLRNTPIQQKLMAVILLTTGVVLLLTCIVFITYEVITLRKTLVMTLTTRAEIIAANSTGALAFESPDDATDVLDALKSDSRTVAACIYDSKGKVFAKYPANAALNEFPGKPMESGYQYDSSSLSVFCPVIQENHILGTVYLRSDLASLTDRYRAYAELSIMVLASSFMLAYFLSKFLQKQISVPILALTEAARAISDRRDYSVRAVKLGRDELGLLTDTFNHMLAQIQQQNQELAYERDLLKTLMDNFPDSIYFKDIQSRFLRVSKSQLEKAFSFCLASHRAAQPNGPLPDHLASIEKFSHYLIGKSDADFFGEEDARAVYEREQEIIRTGEPRLGDLEKIVRRDGSSSWHLSIRMPWRDKDGNIIGTFGTSKDVTDGKETEDRLKVSLKEVNDLKTALDEHAIVAITDPQGNVTYVNDKFCDISKYSREELIGQDHRIVNSGCHSKEFIRDLWTTITHGKVWKGEIKNKAKDGTYYWVDTTIVPFLRADGKPYQNVAVSADVTGRKRAQDEISKLNQELEQRVIQRTAQFKAANKELEAFSYSVSHDLRAPVRHIDGFVELFRKSFGEALPKQGQHYLDIIAKSAKHMGRLIDDLLVFSKMGRMEMQRSRVDVQSLVDEIIAGLEPEMQNRNIVWKKGDLPIVQADPSMLRQVFVNLLSNAIKYSRPRDPAEIEIGCEKRNGTETILFVRDNGVGFDMQYADKLFGVFQRLHSTQEFEGTGIGLANVHRIIGRHGGRVWAESKLENGATFYFSLPKYE